MFCNNSGINTKIVYFHFLQSFYTVVIWSSLSCSVDIEDGVSIITSLPELFFGKAMKSLIESVPPIKEQRRSNPNAIPPCGGAPYSKASKRNPNCFCDSVLDIPNVSKSNCCVVLS